ncbi:hypothetical protein BB559_006898, partial [Furculomyces boomerangus]
TKSKLSDYVFELYYRSMVPKSSRASISLENTKRPQSMFKNVRRWSDRTEVCSLEKGNNADKESTTTKDVGSIFDTDDRSIYEKSKYKEIASAMNKRLLIIFIISLVTYFSIGSTMYAFERDQVSYRFGDTAPKSKSAILFFSLTIVIGVSVITALIVAAIDRIQFALKKNIEAERPSMPKSKPRRKTSFKNRILEKFLYGDTLRSSIES